MPDHPSSAGRPVSTTIRTPDQLLRVFVSSTLQEVADERVAAREAITHLRLAPVMFELGARPHPPQDLYRAYLDQSHIFIGIYWQKYGWVGPGMDISGLEDEYRLSGNKPKLIYIKQPAPDREPRLKDLLDRIRNDNSVSYKPFTSSKELRKLIEQDLLLLLTERFEAAAAAPAEVAPAYAAPNVPRPRQPLIGREPEITTVQNLLQSEDVGLVTLTGTGGTGKSRLAVEIANNLLDYFPDGVYLVKLASLFDASRVMATVADTLGVRESAGAASLLDMLLDFLRDKHLMLVLDNFEQVIAAAPLVMQLLDACPHLKILVTSRIALRVSGEHEVSLLPLTLPEDRRLTAATALQSAAVQLFVQRAQAANPSFAVTEDNASAVVEICRRLDGLPLALELAAARIRLLSPQMLLTRLTDRFAILSGGARDLPTRQQTLRGAIDWSYNLLTADAQALFRRLAVFRGGWTLEAVEAVCTLDGDLNTDLLDNFGSLLENSLLMDANEAGTEPRFTMLETIQEYARERLLASPDQEAGRIARQHARYFLDMAEQAEPHLRTAERPGWLTRLVLEQDNLRTALAYFAGDKDRENVWRLVDALTWFWYLCGYLSEGRTHLEQALAHTGSADRTHARAALLFGAGAYAETQADYAVAHDWLLESAAIFRELGDRRRCAYALLFQALVLVYQPEPDLSAAFDLFRESIDLFRETGDQWGEAYTLTYYGDALLVPQDMDTARSVLETGLNLWRQVGDGWGIGTHLFIIGGVAWYDGEYATARTRCEEAVQLLRQHRDKWGLARGLIRLGYALLYLNEPQPARSIFAESLTLFQEIGNRRGVIYCLTGLGGVAASLGLFEVAAGVFGAIEALVGTTHLLKFGFDQARYQRTLAMARASAKDESAWLAAHAKGQTMTLEQAIAYALEATD